MKDYRALYVYNSVRIVKTMNMSLRMEQWAPSQWQSIIDLVADNRTLKRMAGYRERMGIQYMRDELFYYLADHWVVRAELNLRRATSVSEKRLTSLLRAAEIDVYENTDGSLTVDLDGYSLRLETEVLGRTRISTTGPRTMSVTVNISEESVVLLLRFLGEALFVMENMTEDILMEKEQETMVSNIYSQILRAKLDELGEQYTIVTDEKFITVYIRLKPNRCLRFSVRSEQVQEFANKIEGLIAAANMLNREFWNTGMQII